MAWKREIGTNRRNRDGVKECRLTRSCAAGGENPGDVPAPDWEEGEVSRFSAVHIEGLFGNHYEIEVSYGAPKGLLAAK